jgi:alkylation response protein AidB-like acyl-CoA dehydrogenase
MNVMQSMPEEAVQLTLGETYPEIRDLVRRICSDFPGSYWRKLDDEEAYPTDFVAALTKAGLLAALIPEEYGGLGLPLGAAAATLEEIHANRSVSCRRVRRVTSRSSACRFRSTASVPPFGAQHLSSAPYGRSLR